MSWIKTMKISRVCGQYSKKILIAADCKVDESFVSTLCKRLNVSVDLMYMDTTRESKVGLLMRHFSYIFLALKTVFVGKDYEFVLCWQQFIGFYYGFLSYMKKRRSKIFLFSFIFESRNGLVGKVYRNFVNFALNNKMILGAVCHSSSELVYYQGVFPKNRDKIFFIPYGQSPKSQNIANKNNDYSRFQYFFSGGTSNRDYLTLVNAAKKTNFNLVIACAPPDIAGVEISSNVDVRHDAYGEKFDMLLEESFAVVLTFKDPRISSGQIVLLKAMQIGKPIIVTRLAGSEDYVNENCAFLVEHDNVEQLKETLEYVAFNPLESQRRGNNAKSTYFEKFTIEQFALRVGDLVTEKL